MTQRMRMNFPVSSVKGIDAHRFDRALIEAPDIDAISFGVGSRYVERLDPAIATEKVLGDTSIELIGRYIVLATDQPEIALANDQVQIAAHATDSAITLADFQIRRRIDFEPYSAAVATTLVRRHVLSRYSFFLQTAI